MTTARSEWTSIAFHQVQSASMRYLSMRDRSESEEGILDFGQGVLGAELHPGVVNALRDAVSRGVGVGYADKQVMDELAQALEVDLGRTHPGRIGHSRMAITTGASEAFCGALSVILQPGDEVILARPFYYAHFHWARMRGIRVRFWDVAQEDVDMDHLTGLVGVRTRALVVVTPSNPTGSEISSDNLERIRAFCRRAGIYLVLDETYRSFVRHPLPVHGLFDKTGWADNLIAIYSFSKDFGLAGYRVGALVASEEILRRFAVWRECSSIVPGSLGIVAATASLVYSLDWRRTQEQVVRQKLESLRTCIHGSKGCLTWSSGGALYGWLRHCWTQRRDLDVATWLAREYGIVCMPGSAFWAGETGHLRFSVGLSEDGDMSQLRRRLAMVDCAR